MEHVGIDIKFDNLDTFNKQIDVKFIDLDSELVDLNYKVAYLIFCHVWRSIGLARNQNNRKKRRTLGEREIVTNREHGRTIRSTW